MTRVLACSLALLAACRTSSAPSSPPSGSDDAASDASFIEAGVDAAADASGTSSCPLPLADAGYSSLADFPLASLCTQNGGRVRQWSKPCDGSIVVIASDGFDCSAVWLFDVNTRALQARGGSCDTPAQCNQGIAGFRFPSHCFDGNFSTGTIDLCKDGGASDAAPE